MKKKARGFTAVEMIVVLSLIVIISAIIYTFFSTNNKMLEKTRIRSTLQTQAEKIQNKLIYAGTNGCRLGNIKDASTDDGVSMWSISDSEQSITEFSVKIPRPNVDEVDLSNSNTYYTYRFKLEGSRNKINARKLYLYDPTVKDDSGNMEPILLSDNVEDMVAKTVDSGSGSCNIDKCKGLKIKVKLHQKKGYSDVEYPIETIVKFRNYDVVK